MRRDTETVRPAPGAGWRERLSGLLERHHVVITGLLLGLLVFLGRIPPLLPLQNQNTYLLNGLADAGYGYLSADWTANAQTPFVAFSGIIEGLARIGFLHGTYVVGLGLICLFTVSCTMLFAQCRSAQAWSRGAVGLFALLLLGMTLHDGLMVLMQWGLAGQNVLGMYLQPSEFGVLLIASVALFVARRPAWAYACAALAGVFHPSYLLVGAILVAGFATYELTVERRVGSALAGSAIALAIAGPVAWFCYATFLAAQSADPEAARRILAEIRLFHHAIPAAWFDWFQALKLVVIALSVSLAWFVNRRLAHVMTVAAVLGTLLTGLALLADSHAIYLLFPWRVSTVLLPLGTVVMLTSVVRLAADRGMVRPLSGPRALAAMAAGAAIITAVAFSERLALMQVAEPGAAAEATVQDRQPDYLALVEFARANAAEGQTYLHDPRRYHSFRIRAGLPTFVDFKSHPYRADQVVQWWDRQVWARRVFSGERGCSPALVAEMGEAGITHMIVDRRRDAIDAERILECLTRYGAGPVIVYDNPTYRVIRMDWS